MQIISSFWLVYVVFLGALMSPGPDLLVTLKHSLSYSVRSGIFAAAGIAMGVIVHVAYCMAGIGLLISHSVILFNIIKICGAGYLVYIGIMSLRSKGMDLSVVAEQGAPVKSDRQSFISGFVTNVFNPKATMFFLALFSQMLQPGLPVSWQIGFAFVCVLTAFIWFSLVSVVTGFERFRRVYQRLSKGIDRVFGAFFIALGAKLAFARI